MKELSSQILKKIKNQYIPSLPLDNDMVLPNYEGLSLANIPCTIANLLNVPDFGSPHLDEDITEHLDGPYEKVVLLLVDALGYALFTRMLESQHDFFWKRYVENHSMIFFGNAMSTRLSSARSPVYAQVQQLPH